MVKAVSAATLTKDPTVRKVRIRGQVFTLRELTIGEYDACVAKATEKRINPLTEREEEFVNQTSLLRFMVEKSASLDGKALTISKQSDIEMPVILTLNRLVNDMHFPETEGKDKLWEEVVDEEGEEPSGED
jgi:hypothetical protein